MKVLITGGAGFIGSNLAWKLVEKGYEVTVLDNLFLGKTENLPPDAHFIKGDVRDYSLVKELTKVDVVFHEAAASSAPMFEEPFEAVEVNVNGFVNVLHASLKNKVKKVIYASTSSIYGNNPVPHREDMKVKPINFYSATKLMNEHVASIYNLRGLETVGLRYFSVYGPREKHKGKFANVVSQFLWLMLKNKPPVIYGRGEQTRDFVYVEDVIEANILAFEKNVSGVFNVGTGKETSFNELVKLLNKVLDKEIKPKYVENPIRNYVYRTMADVTKAEKELGFNPKYTLEGGINKILEFEGLKS